MRVTETAERVVAVLDLLGAERDGIGVRAVARHLGVHPSTASRLLATLGAAGLIERDEMRGRYRLGARIVGLAAAAVDRLPVVSQARPELEHLSAVTAETINLAIRDGLHVVYVDQVTPAQTVVMASWVGRRSPVHASSSGKVLLAFGAEGAADLLAGVRLERLTERTVTDPARLAEVLDQVRRQGYAASTGELEEGLVTIAAPVLVDDAAVAAISVSGPAYRLPARDVSHLARQVMDAAAAASHRMAGRT
ncbi:MAG: IclR family transcriptional regulator [Actinomycetota bacterium]